ncbi:glutaredoxin family protein [Clostridium algidicarnis]|uniref:glutaredoxin family protein n=1 Tax=Clostridium algidicarnis TaxID=37659 RepID=UPI001C0CE17F|nr:glutaredoxin family protein [Clostridium algidicarnis]MBU3196555.1 glutaredoxin family protein [Clostridium algidicarnis]MBU3209908.1 glutaredoxin family protein [Clostridium algidicarnis]MBU3228446.1 glutaredoxin family protein [Clostridium algidicarnis]MBU3252189.1 glutaredoxin family protein [Clostridium algidicarnis]
MKNVVIYTSDTCTFCSAAKEYFKENNVSYEEKNVKEPANRKELMAMGIMSVPVIKIDGETVIGFNQSEVEALLNK